MKVSYSELMSTDTGDATVSQEAIQVADQLECVSGDERRTDSRFSHR